MKFCQVFWIFVLASACASNHTAPKLNNEVALTETKSYSVLLKEPLEVIQIRRDGAGSGSNAGLGLEAAAASEVGSSIQHREDQKISSLLEKYDTSEVRSRIENHMVDSLCESLEGKCGDETADAKIFLTPLYVGYRFDQAWNVLYVPTYVCKVEVVKNGVRIFEHIVGTGNLARMESMRKIGTREDLGYKKPEQISQFRDQAIDRIEFAIEDVSQAIANYLVGRDI